MQTRFWLAALVAGCGGSGIVPPGAVDAGPDATVEESPPDAGMSPAKCTGLASRCGDGVATGRERCDGPDLRGETCATLGSSGGTLRCDPGCNLDRDGCTGTGESGFDWLIELSCERVAQCADELGTRWDPRECARRLARSYRELASWADAPGIARCGAFLASASCGELAELDQAAACRGIFRVPFLAVDEPCVPDGICPLGTACAPRPADGRFCWRCTPLPGVGEPCSPGSCAPELLCDPASARCVVGADAPCTTDADCAINHPDELDPTGFRAAHFCNPEGRCELRGPGAPCRRPASDACDVPDLACVAGQCAARAPLGGACDSRDDCADATLACRGGSCQPALGRGEPCTDSDACGGVLVCDGTCTDRPGPGEACAIGQPCIAPARCSPIDRICHTEQEGWLTLATGATCADPVCAPHHACSQWYGQCAVGSCDDAGTMTCLSWRPVGASCAPTSPCDPLVARCEAGRCQPLCAIGEPCATNADCDPGTAFCDGSCQPLRPDGALCATGGECEGGVCTGRCVGGSLAGAPCTAGADCLGGGVCDEVTRCSAPGVPFPRCVP